MGGVAENQEKSKFSLIRGTAIRRYFPICKLYIKSSGGITAFLSYTYSTGVAARNTHYIGSHSLLLYISSFPYIFPFNSAEGSNRQFLNQMYSHSKYSDFSVGSLIKNNYKRGKTISSPKKNP